MPRKKKITAVDPVIESDQVEVTSEVVAEATAPGTLIVSNELLNTVSKAFDRNFAMLLVGDTGTGKTSLVRQEAKKRGLQFSRINFNGQTDTADILGKWLIKDKSTVWQDGLLTKAVKEGHALLLDEINACPAEVLFALHGLLEDQRYLVLPEKDGEVVEAHEEFRIFATMNPSEGYEGTRELNRAFLSRFKIVANIEYSDKEAEILTDQYGLEAGLAGKLVHFATETRATYKAQASDFLISTRDLINVAQLVAEGFKFEEALDLAVINKATPSEGQALRQLAELIMGFKIKDYATGKTVEDLKAVKESYERLQEEHKNCAVLAQAHGYLLRDAVHSMFSEMQNGALLARKIMYRSGDTVPTRHNQIKTEVYSNRRIEIKAKDVIGIEIPTKLGIHGIAELPVDIDFPGDNANYLTVLHELMMVAGNLRNYNYQLSSGLILVENWKNEVVTMLEDLLKASGNASSEQMLVRMKSFMEYILTDTPPTTASSVGEVKF